MRSAAGHRFVVSVEKLVAIRSPPGMALAGKLDTAAAIQLILTHVSANVPDAVIALQPSTEVLENLARAKLQEAAQVVTPDRLADAQRQATG